MLKEQQFSALNGEGGLLSAARKKRTRGIRGLLHCCCVWMATHANAERHVQHPDDETPKPTPLTETLEKRLVQLNVGVEGDPERSVDHGEDSRCMSEFEVPSRPAVGRLGPSLSITSCSRDVP